MLTLGDIWAIQESVRVIMRRHGLDRDSAALVYCDGAVAGMGVNDCYGRAIRAQ